MREKKAPCGKKMKRSVNKQGAVSLQGSVFGSKTARNRTKQAPKPSKYGHKRY